MANDLLNELTTRASSAIKKVKPVQQDEFLPAIPKTDINSSIPPEVLAAMAETEAASRLALRGERNRLDAKLNYMQLANQEIGDARDKMDAIVANPLTAITGLFNDDDNYMVQQGKIDAVQRKLKVKEFELNTEAAKDAIDLKESSLPLDTFTKQMTMRKDIAGLSVIENQAIVSSNAAKKQILTMQQSRVPWEDIVSASKTRSFTNIITPKFVKTSMQDQAEFADKMATSELARKDKQFDLSQKTITSALKFMPVGLGSMMLADADKKGLSKVLIPGTSFSIPTDMMRNAVAKKRKVEDDSFAALASRNKQLVQNNPVISSALSSVANVSSIYSSGTPQIGNLSALTSMNGVNITDETLSEIDMSNVPRDLRIPLMDALQSSANLNLKQSNSELMDKNGKPVGDKVIRAEIESVKQKFTKLKELSDKLSVSAVESSSKLAKPAMKEWSARGRVDDQDNASNMVLANIVSQVNLGNSPSLKSAYQVLRENFASAVVDEELDFTGMTAAEKQNAIMQGIVGSDARTKTNSRELVIKALYKKNSEGLTPLDAYTKTRTYETLNYALDELKNVYPEYAGFFSKLKTKTQLNNVSQIAQTITELSFKLQQQNPEIPDMKISEDFIGFMNDYLEKYKVDNNSQVNPARGSFMSLLFNTDPTVFVQTAITGSFGQPARAAWEELKAGAQANTEYAQYLGVPAAQAPQATVNTTRQYSPIDLPIR